MYKAQLGEVIRARREELGLTQKQVAERASIQEPQTVSRWERGENIPTDLEAVARALDYTVAELLGRLQPVTQKERRRLDPGAPTQLDRIEQKLNALLWATQLLGVEGVPERYRAMLEEADVAEDEHRAPSRAPRRRAG